MRAFGNIEANYQRRDQLRASRAAVGFDALGLDETAVGVAARWIARTRRARTASASRGAHRRDEVPGRRLRDVRAALARDEHDLSIVGGASVEYNKSDAQLHPRRRIHAAASARTSATRRNVTEYDGSVDGRTTSSSFFARADWSLQRPLPAVGASLRADGSSRFGDGQPLRHVPGRVGRLGRERGAVRARARSASCNIKLRASYGATGNQGIGDFAAPRARERVAVQRHAGHRALAARQSRLTWETTQRARHRRRPAVLRRPREPDGGLLQAATHGPARAAPDPGDDAGSRRIWDNIGDDPEQGPRPRRSTR